LRPDVLRCRGNRSIGAVAKTSRQVLHPHQTVISNILPIFMNAKTASHGWFVQLPSAGHQAMQGQLGLNCSPIDPSRNLRHRRRQRSPYGWLRLARNPSIPLDRTDKPVEVDLLGIVLRAPA
jgi:hypothetical protein